MKYARCLAIAWLGGCLSLQAAPPFGEITAPEDGSCHGPDALPVFVEDSYDPAHDRRYEPRGGIAKLWATGEPRFGVFGSAVAVRGDLAVVGAPAPTGVAHVYRLVGPRWVEEQRLGSGTMDFGRSVALDAGSILVGATGDLRDPSSTGAVDVFRRDAGVWVHVQKIVPEDTSRVRDFGRSMLVSGDTLFVGASGMFGAAQSAGAVFVFHRDGGSWVQRQRLIAREGEHSDSFGRSIAVDGDTLAVGARDDNDRGPGSGSVYVFERTAHGWVERHKITGSDTESWDYFGQSVGLAGDLLVVGAVQDDDLGPRSGSVYVFERSGGTWHQRQKLYDVEDGAFADFGWQVHASPDRIIATATGPGAQAGAALFFRRSGAVWELDRRRAGHGSWRNSRFGAALAVEGDIFAYGEPSGFGADVATGAAFIDGATPFSSYQAPGDYLVRLTVTDEHLNRDSDSVRFTVDVRPPFVFVSQAGSLTIPTTIPFSRLFQAWDENSTAGDIVHERALWDGCLLFDGLDYGDGDGRLIDEVMVLDEATACDALDRCDLEEFSEPWVRIEAIDCGGNVGTHRRIIPVLPAFDRERCKGQ